MRGHYCYKNKLRTWVPIENVINNAELYRERKPRIVSYPNKDIHVYIIILIILIIA